MKDTSIECMINESREGNKVKIKLNLKIKKFTEIAVLIFCEINGSTPRFCLV